MMTVFGPIPSRRLGRSLGVNNIPPKNCTYSCGYCQIGTPGSKSIERRPFYGPDAILDQVRCRIEECREDGQPIDYVSFVPDGEPTLDVNLGREIDLLRPLGIRIAVITNGSLLDRADVRAELGSADWVGIKIDAATPDVWRRVNRPHRALSLSDILRGIKAFAAEYGGELTTQTMLIRGLNDFEAEIVRIADQILQVGPSKAYISVPTRPPTVKTIEPAHPDAVNLAYQVFEAKGIKAELITGHEGDAFAAAGDVIAQVLAITAVHPMREDSLRALLARTGADWGDVEDLVSGGKLRRVSYMGRRFYIREFV
jgi:wyosine [tRNA(Phe)-imidazoG37] synthetase (radical SAM superfamily)